MSTDDPRAKYETWMRELVPRGRAPATWLGRGGLYMLLDPEAGPRPERLLAVDLPTLEQWPIWAQTEMAWRVRPMERAA